MFVVIQCRRDVDTIELASVIRRARFTRVFVSSTCDDKRVVEPLDAMTLEVESIELNQ